ncbi:MAG TPA: Gfo/Idh/MocA family oxidoreductase, partial [Candidatus Acidoferrales bacterium]
RVSIRGTGDTMTIERREFLKATGAAVTAGAASLALSGKAFGASGRVLGANDRVQVAICGVRGRGNDHIKGYAKVPQAQIAALCDVDENVLNERLAELDKMGLPKAQSYGDVRKLLENKDIDAISIATPNHWHSLIAIWALQAGKDVYVEKPCSHNLYESKQLIAAVKKYNRIVQHGSQSRSNPGMIEAIKHVNDGTIGDTYMARALCYKWRPSIGHAPQEPVPAGVNYDLWTGPAPLKPFTRNRFHYNWHWIWDTGNGDIGNQGIHEVDIARWGLGVDYPTYVNGMGAHFMFDDDQQTPNLLNAVFYFDAPDTPAKRKMLEVEVRPWMTNHEAEIGTGAYSTKGVPAAGLAPSPKPAAPKPATASKVPLLGPSGNEPSTIGNIFYGSNGYLGIDGYDSYKTWLTDKQVPGPSGHGDGDHFQNFIDCVKSRDAEELHAPIIEGHKSVTLIHLANASYRLGRSLKFDPVKQEVIGDEEASVMLRGTYRPPYVVPEKV